MKSSLNYKLIDEILVIDTKLNTLLFDPLSLILFTEKDKNNIQETINVFKNYKKQLKKDKNVPEQSRIQKKDKKISICLLLSNDCNLNCLYCYADGGNYTDLKGKMNNENIDKTLKFISKNFNSQKKLYITFFGGEPLLFPKSIKYFINRSRDLLPNTKLSFSMTTNGTILNDDIFTLLKDNNINFQISLDGDKSIQDNIRKTKNGHGSYAQISKNLEKFKKLNKNLVFRTTITAKNLYVSKIYKHFKNLGAKIIHFEIVEIASTNELFLNNKDIDTYKEELNKLAKIYYKDFLKEKKPIDITNFTRFFKLIHFGIKKYRSCGIYNSLIAINFKGEIYPCHRFVGMKNFKLADTSQNFDIEKPNEMIKDIDKHPSCKKCFAKNLCGGGCFHINLNTKDAKKLFSSPHCQIFRHTIALSIWLYANLIQSKKKDNFIKFIQPSSFKTNS